MTNDNQFSDSNLEADILILKDNIGLNEDTIAFSAIQYMGWKLINAETEEGYLSVLLIGTIRSYPVSLETYKSIRNRYIRWQRTGFIAPLIEVTDLHTGD